MDRGIGNGVTRHVRAVALVMVVVVLSLAASAHAAGVVRLIQRDGAQARVLTLSAQGLNVTSRERACAKCALKPFSGVTIVYRTGRLLLTDPVHHVYEAGALKALFALARRETAKLAKPSVIPGLGEVARPPKASVVSAGHTTIAGLPATGLVIVQGTLQERVWFGTSLPRPPAAVQQLFGGLDSAASGALAAHSSATHGAPVLSVQVRSGKRWRALLTTTRAVRLRRLTLTLKPPHGYVGQPLMAPAKATASSVPATAINLGIGPVVGHPRIYPVYWGSWFAHNPSFVHELNSRLGQMVQGHDGFMNGLAQYGVNPGTIGTGFTNGEDPPATVGTWNFFATEGMLFGHLGINGTPRGWGRLDSTDPIIMVFVPQSAVFSSAWAGYHFGVATEAGLFPWNQPLMPYTIVKVQDDAGSDTALDNATQDASHEFVEAATDPVPFLSWIDPLKEPVWNDGELSDICESPSAPWLPHTRLGGIAYSTYWSNADHACVPSSRPTVSVFAPTANANWPCGVVPLHGGATDPFDGRVTDPASFRWSDGSTLVATGNSTSATLSPGVHSLTLTVTDSQGQSSTSAPITVTVTPPTPQLTISAPTAGSVWGTDQSVPFTGAASTSCEGALPSASLVWSENGTTLGTGASISHMFTTQGTHTVILSATSSQAITGHASVTFTVGPPSGNPTVQITSPADGSNEPDVGATWMFTGSGSDPHDGALSGSSLQWDDTYTDAGGVAHNHVPLGSGTSFTAQLYWNGTSPTTHVIRLVATDSLGHTSTVSVTVTAGAYS